MKCKLLTAHGSRLTAIIILFLCTDLAPSKAQDLTPPPTFEAIVLDEEEATFYKIAKQNSTIFTFPLKELVQYVNGLPEQQDIEFTLKIGELDAALILSANKDGWIPNPNKTGQSKLVILKGTVRGQPSSKAFISISPSSFYANIVAGSKKYLISYAIRDGKSIPNVFSLVENQYVQPTKKTESPISESACGSPLPYYWTFLKRGGKSPIFVFSQDMIIYASPALTQI